MTPEAAEGWRIRARNDPLDFCRWMFKSMHGQKFIVTPIHLKMNAFFLRLYAGQIPRGIINIMPRAGKTITVAHFIAWGLGQYPDSEWIYASFSADLASNTSYDVREIVQSEEYQRIFPGTRLSGDSTARDHWKTTAGGQVKAAGNEGTLTGFGAGKKRPGFGGALIGDDLLKPNHALSDTMREKVNRWFSGTFRSRRNTPDTPILIIGQRLHEDDICGFLLSGGSREHWEVLTISVLDESGESVWPEMYPTDEMKLLEEADPYTFAGQYMQRPAPLEGGIVKPDRLVHVDAIPAGTTFCRGWDLAASHGKGDWTAGALVGRCPDGHFIIADVRRVQEGPDGVRALLLGTANEDPQGTPISIPQDPGAAGKTLVLDYARLLSGFSVEFSPESGDKVSRAMPLFAQINVGNVYILNGAWNAAFKDELRLMPNGKHDDQVDAASRAFARVSGSDLWLETMYAGMRDEEETEAAPVADSWTSIIN